MADQAHSAVPVYPDHERPPRLRLATIEPEGTPPSPPRQDFLAHELVVELAKLRIADIPHPSEVIRGRVDRRSWEDRMLEAAEGIAAAVGHDAEVLRHAVGPAVEVGASPPWRVLLEVALTLSAPLPR